MPQSISIIGDSHAPDIGNLMPTAIIKSAGGISLNDSRIRDWFEESQDSDKIYFCCSHPLCGYSSKTLLINLLNSPIGTRFSNRIKPGYMDTNWLDTIKQSLYLPLYTLWKDQIQYFVETYPQTILIPLLANFAPTSIAGVEPDPIDLLVGFPQIKTGHLRPEHYKPDGYGHLSDQGLLSLDFDDIQGG